MTMFAGKCGRTEVSREKFMKEEEMVPGFPAGQSVASRWEQDEWCGQGERVEGQGMQRSLLFLTDVSNKPPLWGLIAAALGLLRLFSGGFRVILPEKAEMFS